MEKEINENIIEIEGKKYKFIEAEKSICCRSCDLRKDRRCHLLHRMCISDNRKDKKEGYFKIVDLENYIPKGELQGFPKEIISRMLDCQEEQGNPRDVSVFERQIDAKQCNKGFDWGVTQEGWNFWCVVINNKDFNLFFKKYPKQEYQELKTKTMEEKRNLKINFKQAEEMFEGDNEILKKLALEVFPELKHQPITDRVKTYEDALRVLGRDHFDVKNLYPREIARRKLERIIEALNEGWKPDLSNHQEYKSHCYFRRSSMGLSYSHSVNSNMFVHTYVGVRLLLKSKELADYCGTQFKYLYEIVLLR